MAPVREALAPSRWLIVVCSPETARSHWVAQEIMLFKQLHGEEGASGHHQALGNLPNRRALIVRTHSAIVVGGSRDLA